MAVIPAGFSERAFEFGFNAEYAQSTVLAGIPFIPTQNQEKTLGYDVRFAIASRGGAVRYIALQHKVARFVSGGTGVPKYRAAVGQDYYAFRLDVDQFNLIEAVASKPPPGFELYYCAPVFTTLGTINKHYLANAILANSVWLDISGNGPLTTHEPHTLVYAANAASAAVFSETPRALKVLRPTDRPSAVEVSSARVPQVLYSQLLEVVEEYWSRNPSVRPPLRQPLRRTVRSESDAISRIRELVTDYLGCSLFIEVPNQGIARGLNG